MLLAVISKRGRERFDKLWRGKMGQVVIYISMPLIFTWLATHSSCRSEAGSIGMVGGPHRRHLAYQRCFQKSSHDQAFVRQTARRASDSLSLSPLEQSDGSIRVAE